MQPLASRWRHLDGKRVHAGLYFVVERFHDEPVLRKSAQTVKMPGRDSDPEMGFSAFPPSGIAGVMGMAGVARALVDHFEQYGIEAGGEFVGNGLANAHGVQVSGADGSIEDMVFS
jgi:hypothetical protein